MAELIGELLQWTNTNGHSLLPILTGEADTARHRDHVRCEYYDAPNMYLTQEPGRHTPCWATMYRDERHKLVNYHGLGYGELYNLESPLEVNNLWDDPPACNAAPSCTDWESVVLPPPPSGTAAWRSAGLAAARRHRRHLSGP